MVVSNKIVAVFVGVMAAASLVQDYLRSPRPEPREQMQRFVVDSGSRVELAAGEFRIRLETIESCDGKVRVVVDVVEQVR